MAVFTASIGFLFIGVGFYCFIRRRAANLKIPGTVYQPTYKDKRTGEYKKSTVWWIQYCARGQVKRESSESTKESDARKLLRRRHGEVEAGKPVGPDVTRTTFEDMASMVTNDYKANNYSSLNRAEDSIEHLRGFFGNYRAIEITSDKVTAYVTHRQEQKAANSTIDNELSALSRMFTLAMRARKAAARPYIAKLATNNTRKGFFEREQLDAVLRHLPEDLKPVIECAFITGWRVHDEILTRQRHHVDLKAGWLRLDPGETKNREGRNFPLTPRLRELLQKQIARTEALQRAESKIISWLFHRDGKPIKSFRRSWITACVNAGLGTKITGADGKLVKKTANRIPHDFRRTAVRNLERAGVSRSDAMAMVGHRTESVYRRYAISDETSLKEAGQKLAALHEQDFLATDKVLHKSEAV